MIILRTKEFSELREGIKTGFADWVASRNPHLKEVIERKKESSKETEQTVDEDPRNARVKGRRNSKQPLRFKAPEISFVSPYDPPKEYKNWKGEAKNYYSGNVYYRRPEREELRREEEIEEEYD